MWGKGKIKSRTKFIVKGLNQEKMLNKLIQSVKIYNFNRTSYDVCQFETDFKNHKVVKCLLIEHGMEIVKISHFGFLSKVTNFVTAYGIIFAIAISSLFYALQYSFIWKIEVYGEDKIEERQVKEFITKKLPSKFKGRIDTKDMEQKIKENFKQISSVSVAIIGQTLVLNLNEAVLPEEMEGEYLPLISDFDGLVTEINLIQGTLAVNEGSLVRKGDVLVYPYIIDSQGGERAVAPKAEVYADVWLCEKNMHYDYQIVVNRTGRRFCSSKVYLNNLLIYSQNKSHNFQQFEIEEQESQLTKNLLLPFKICKTTYYETQTIEIKTDFEENKDKIIASTREKVLIFVEENEIIKEENYTIREEGGCHEISYVITVNRNIGG